MDLGSCFLGLRLLRFSFFGLRDLSGFMCFCGLHVFSVRDF